MKRSPLGPGRKSLERGSTFANRGGSLRRTRRLRGKPTDAQIEARDLAAERGDCWLSRHAPHKCSGPWQLAHLIPAERLRFYNVPESEIWHPAIVRACCAEGHRLLDAHLLSLDRSAIPIETEHYAAEWRLVWLLDRLYGAIGDEQTAPEIDWPNAA